MRKKAVDQMLEFFTAIEEGKIETVQRFLDSAIVYINAADIFERTGLMKATLSGRKDVVELLTKYGANVNLQDKSGASALMISCTSGHLHICEYLIDNGAEVDLKDRNSLTALYHASINSHVPVIDLLIANGSDITLKDANGFTVLMKAAWDGNTRVVEFLVSKGATDLDSALVKAALNGNVQVVEVLLERGANINGTTDYGWTALGKDSLVSHGSSLYPMTLPSLIVGSAAKANHTNVVNFLLDRGADVNVATVDRETALMGAACNSNIALLQRMLKMNAHVDAQAADGYTALMRSIYPRCDVAAAELLISMGNADVHIKSSEGHTALMVAAVSGKANVGKVLLLKKVDVNAVDSNGETAIMKAALANHDTILELMIEHGGHVHIKNNEGKTALTLAREKYGKSVFQFWRKKADCIKILEKAARKQAKTK